MNIRCARVFGPDRDRFTCTVDGRTFNVVLRPASAFPDALNIDNPDLDSRETHISLIDKPRKADKVIGKPFANG